jgi:hypothetical protein
MCGVIDFKLFSKSRNQNNWTQCRILAPDESLSITHLGEMLSNRFKNRYLRLCATKRPVLVGNPNLTQNCFITRVRRVCLEFFNYSIYEPLIGSTSMTGKNSCICMKRLSHLSNQTCSKMFVCGQRAAGSGQRAAGSGQRGIRNVFIQR